MKSAKLLNVRRFLSGATAFLASASRHLPPSDVWCILYPSLRHLLRSDIREIDEVTLLTTMKSPVCALLRLRGQLRTHKGSADAEAHLQRCSCMGDES